MSGIAYKGLPIQESTKSGYISYQYKVWNPNKTWVDDSGTHGDGSTWDNSHWEGGWDYYSGTSNAIVSGFVDSGSPNVFVNGGNPVATDSDQTNETWTNSGFNSEFVSASPSENGSGKGTLKVSSSNVFVNGKRIATDGTPVKTCIDGTSQIKGGSPNVFAN